MFIKWQENKATCARLVASARSYDKTSDHRSIFKHSLGYCVFLLTQYPRDIVDKHTWLVNKLQKGCLSLTMLKKYDYYNVIIIIISYYIIDVILSFSTCKKYFFSA